MNRKFEESFRQVKSMMIWGPLALLGIFVAVGMWFQLTPRSYKPPNKHSPIFVPTFDEPKFAPEPENFPDTFQLGKKGDERGFGKEVCRVVKIFRPPIESTCPGTAFVSNILGDIALTQHPAVLRLNENDYFGFVVGPSGEPTDELFRVQPWQVGKGAKGDEEKKDRDNQ